MLNVIFKGISVIIARTQRDVNNTIICCYFTKWYDNGTTKSHKANSSRDTRAAKGTPRGALLQHCSLHTFLTWDTHAPWLQPKSLHPCSPQTPTRKRVLPSASRSLQPSSRWRGCNPPSPHPLQPRLRAGLLTDTELTTAHMTLMTRLFSVIARATSTKGCMPLTLHYVHIFTYISTQIRVPGYSEADLLWCPLPVHWKKKKAWK